MRNLLRNLRLPGTQPRPYRGRPGVARPGSPRSLSRPGTPQRRYAVSRVETQPSRRRLHVPWRRIGVSIGAAAMLAGALYGGTWLVTGETLRVHAIDISGAQVVDPHAVAAASGLGGQSMLTLDLRGAAEAIEAFPAVKAVTVERSWPQGVRVTIVEHQAWGYWQAGGRVYTIDEAGRVLAASRPAPADAPTIVDLASPRELADRRVGDPDTVRLVAQLRHDRVFERAGVRASAFLFQRDRGLTVVAEDGPDAVFGDSSNYQFKVQALDAVLRELRDGAGGSALQVAEIDLRFGRNVVLR